MVNSLSNSYNTLISRLGRAGQSLSAGPVRAMTQAYSELNSVINSIKTGTASNNVLQGVLGGTDSAVQNFVKARTAVEQYSEALKQLSKLETQLSSIEASGVYDAQKLETAKTALALYRTEI